jgi:hypothetical protein
LLAGKRQSLAVGFLVGSVCFLFCFRSGDQSQLTWQFTEAAKLNQPRGTMAAVLNDARGREIDYPEREARVSYNDMVNTVARAANAVAGSTSAAKLKPPSSAPPPGSR